MSWLWFVLGLFLGLGLCGSWEAGVGILFMLVYPLILYSLSKVGIISYSPILLPIAFVFWTGALYQLLKEERETKRFIRKALKEIEKRKN